MNHYEEKKRAFLLIEELLEKHTPIEHIYYVITKNYAYSTKYVDKQIKIIEQAQTK